ncbi:MAG TPA: glycosyltransferase family 4 protein, partial [Firmicutes bacterium]|nr:glycosyltransferase family 4 protein [Bacillota bacterium]
MRVLFLSHGANLDGGAEKVLLRIIAGLDLKRFAPVVVLPGKGQFSARLEELGIPYYLVPQFWMVFRGAKAPVLAVNCLLNIAPVRRLCRVIAQERIDLVYSNTIVIFGGGVAARLAGVPHVWHLHEFVFRSPSLEFGFGGRILKRTIDVLADRVIAVSRAVADDLGLSSTAGKVAVVPNGLLPESWAPVPMDRVENLRCEFGVPERGRIIVFLGNLVASKAPEKAVEASGRIKRQDVYLIMVGGHGEKPTMRRIEQAIARYGLAGRVILTGYRTDVPRFLAAADVAIVPTLTEAWGLATAEAMAAGLPVVAGKGGNNVDLIEDGGTGYLVENGDPEGMARRIEQLLDDEGLRRRMGEAAREAS